MCKSVDGQHAAKSTRDAFQRDTFEVDFALLTAQARAWTMMLQCVLACMPLRVWCVHGLDGEFANYFNRIFKTHNS